MTKPNFSEMMFEQLKTLFPGHTLILSRPRYDSMSDDYLRRIIVDGTELLNVQWPSLPYRDWYSRCRGIRAAEELISACYDSIMGWKKWRYSTEEEQSAETSFHTWTVIATGLPAERPSIQHITEYLDALAPQEDLYE